MAADTAQHPTATEKDYPAHQRNYRGLHQAAQMDGAGVAFLIALIVMFLISN